MYSQISRGMFATGHSHAFNAKKLKYSDTQSLLWVLLLLQMQGLIINRFTRWPEAVPILDKTTQTVPQAFVSGWISCFGIRSTITMDKGKQFESSLSQQLIQLSGCNQIRTTSYHPMANGMIERFHRQLKAIIKSYPNITDWVHSLPMALLGICTTLK